MDKPQTEVLYWCKNEEGIFHKFYSTPDHAPAKIFELFDPERRHTWRHGKLADLINTETLDSV